MSEITTRSDGWLFAALMIAAELDAPVLTDVIEVGDAINHAILSLDELNGGFGRFHDMGLVTIERDRFRPTEAAWALFRRCKRENWYETVNAARLALTEAAESRRETGSLLEDPITPAQFDQAYADYRVRADRQYAEFKRRERDKNQHE
jgi:hypothetical protein